METLKFNPGQKVIIKRNERLGHVKGVYVAQAPHAPQYDVEWSDAAGQIQSRYFYDNEIELDE